MTALAMRFTLVHRRAGGLERTVGILGTGMAVHRRAGGLENCRNVGVSCSGVHRRAGGLESYN